MAIDRKEILMKKTLLSTALICLAQLSFSQNTYKRPFFMTSLATTLTINENYTLDADDGEPFLLPSSIILRTGVGYQLHRRFLLSVHAGFDHHWGYDISAIPAYGTFRFNITERDGNTFFIETSYGKLWRPSKRFSDGNYSGIGIGFEAENQPNRKSSLRLKYHRKSILGFENNRLDSFSIGFGLSFF